MSRIGLAELKCLPIKDKVMLRLFRKTADRLLKSKRMTREEILLNFRRLLENPERYAIEQDGDFSDLARQVLQRERQQQQAPVFRHNIDYNALEKYEAYTVFGKHLIDESALQQMDAAMSLPVAVAGALMPDAHVGYGLPIGGVLATDPNVVIPYAVGVDIACRMSMSVFDLSDEFLFKEDPLLKRLLQEHTYFGVGATAPVKYDDSIFDRPEWQATKTLRSLRDKAYAQLGTSGSGNHFVEWGILEITHPNDALKLPAGKYLALLSHSGSRGLGGKIAATYSSIAMQKTDLPETTRHLAWLELTSEAGQEYWLSMQLAGDYAAANHHEIHRKIARALNHKPLVMIENHHNFAWKETLPDGREVIVHRKGATPAGKDMLGVIPGSMTSPGFVVKGKAAASSLASASHGAGRVLSRRKAIRELDKDDVKAHIEQAGVQLIGAGLDEAPMVYKNIFEVMDAQKELIEVLAVFYPKIVRMADSKEPAED